MSPLIEKAPGVSATGVFFSTSRSPAGRQARLERNGVAFAGAYHHEGTSLLDVLNDRALKALSAIHVMAH
ncbi:MAG: hypothetical protein JXO51_05550 [Candidatus Aminicenantes bacterium]|nr:hypothetical protein [Candidatus Aminicenantes bacterium]